MSLADEIINAQAGREKVPAGWEPYAEEAGRIGSAITRLPTPKATARDLLVSAGFNPDEWRISGTINTRRWMRYDQEWLYYYKFDVEQGESEEAVELHIEELTKRIRRRKPAAPKATDVESDVFLLVLSDWQVGKAHNGVGTPELIDRVKDCLRQATAQVRALRKRGIALDSGAIVGLGDLVEQCWGNYGTQTFSVDLNLRDQNRVARELIYLILDTMLGLFPEVTVAAVGGNHGQTRVKGDVVTDMADNMDVSCFEAVREAYDRAGTEGLTWHIPQHELTMCIELAGVPIGLAHGHTFSKGSTSQQRASNWWRDQVFGMQPVQHARILLSAHWHHLSVVTFGARTHIQAPALDCGSAWWTEISGDESPAGMLSMRITRSTPTGYADLSVFYPEKG